MSGVSGSLSLEDLLKRYEMERVGWGGTRRCCWKLGDSGLCVKFYKPRTLYFKEKVKPSIQRDIDKRRFDEVLNSGCQEVATLEHYRRILPEEITALFPEVCQRVYHPDFGWGVLETYYTNPDGSAIIPYEFEIARQTPRNRQIIYAQAKAVLQALIDAAAPFYEPGNFHTLILPDGSIQTKIVDFEPTSKVLIRLEVVWPWYRRNKLRRKAVRYLKHIRDKYGVEDKDLAWLAAEDAFGCTFKSFDRIHAGNSSQNFRAVAEDGTPYFVKFAKPKSIARDTSRLSKLDSPLIPGLAFGGRKGTFGDKEIIATRWCTGKCIPPHKLTPAEIAAIVSGYDEISRALSAIPAESLAAPQDAAAVEAQAGAMIRPIHGDFHYRNFFFRDGALSACFDFEMMRMGLPAEDFLRIFVHAIERTRFWRFARLAAIKRNLAEMVRTAPCQRGAWIAAIDLYERHKYERRAMKTRRKWVAKLEKFIRAPLYRSLRRLVETA